MMNFTSSSNNHRNPVLRAGLKGSSFAASFIVKPELVNGGNNNNIQSAGTHSFLTISKSRVPDIQMINKYYGLVPKKFVINTRSDYSSKQSTKLQRARTAHSFNEENSTSADFIDGIMLTKNKLKEFHDDSQVYFKHRRGSIDDKDLQGVLGLSSPSQSERDGELVARKIQVEKHKKWKRIKDCGRSLSMMENCDNMMGHCTKGGSSHRESHHSHSHSDKQPDIQRVIKIDLNNMRWEESYKPKSPFDTDKSFSDSSSLNSPQSQQILNGNHVPDDTTTISNGNSKNNNNLLPTQNSNLASARRKGFMRKTISFDEQIMKNASSENSINVLSSQNGTTKSDKEMEMSKPPPRRPVTASSRSSTTNSTSQQSSFQSVQKIPPWTNKIVGQSDRRSKFQKSFSVYSESMDGFGAESENEQEFSESASNLSSNSLCSSQKYRESKKSLHVQPPPEISTMISLMSPPPDKEKAEDLQNEIDKVSVILNNMQDKLSQVDENKSQDEQEEDDEKLNLINKKECEGQAEPVNVINEDMSDKIERPLPVVSTPSPDLSPIVVCGKGRRPLVKAASISCETELFSPPSLCGNEAKKIRPQTSKTRSAVSFSSTTSTRLIPPRSLSTTHLNSGTTYPSSSGVSRLESSTTAAGTASLATETLQSQASKNRKILIKKALIEINQSSINLGKKFNHGRPKTAPTLDVNKKSSISINKRQPLKASSSPIKMPTVLRKNSTLNAKMDTKNSSKEASPEPEPEPSPPKVRVLPRQSSFNSVTDGFLVTGFPSELNNESDDITKDAAASFLNSKKREQCLKIYEKMMKKGCAVKLETIFRGMMTPSEYRLFLQATENAEKNSTESDTIENVNPGDGDAGVSIISEKHE